ncbi:MAG: hypothetical protein MUO72_18730 [Bacteroidales bacterium]|nr:hypothetical protein [Bacteroidales bacterium]
MRIRFLKTAVILLTAIICYSSVSAQNKPNDVVAGIPVNYDEALTGTYSLPDPLVMLNGKKVKNAKTWYNKRRPEIVRLFEEFEYGRTPGRPKDMTFNVFDKGTPALDGKVVRKQVTVYFTRDTSNYKMDILIYLPANTTKPVPLFLHLSFGANATVADDPGIKAGYIRGRDGKKVPVTRKGGFGRMDINQFLSQGIGYANIYYGDIEPDLEWLSQAAGEREGLLFQDDGTESPF